MMVRVFPVFQFWWWSCKFPCALGKSENFRSSLSVCLWFSSTSFLLAWEEFSCRLAWGCPISEFELKSTSFLLAWGEFSCRLLWGCSISEFGLGSTSCLVALTTSFLSSAFTGLTRDPKLREEISSLLCLRSRNTRRGLAFTFGEPSFEVVFWPLFDMALCFPIGSGSSERKLLKWLQE